MWSGQYSALLTRWLTSLRKDVQQYNSQLPMVLGIQKVDDVDVRTGNTGNPSLLVSCASEATADVMHTRTSITEQQCRAAVKPLSSA
jgi:hypothetical protein